MKTLSHGFGAVVGITVGEGLNVCLLGNGRIETKRLTREEEFIELLFKERPVLVSLSVGTGGDGSVGLNVSNDSQARTATLAKAIRTRGFAVVGSDLSVADSLLGKRRQAVLGQVGAVSTVSPARLPRDQHDAITAGVVGWLFWAGRFDVIEETDDFSIVAPSNETSLDRWSDRAAIGLSGPIGSGKTTAGMYLRKQGFHYARYSLVIETIARESGTEPSRGTLQDLGREIHETHGQYWLGKQLLKSLPDSGCIVIDGLRYPEDHAFLSGSFGPCFGHIAIVTPPEARRRQFIESKPAEDYERAMSHQSERGVEEVVSLAHRTVTNDGSRDEFLKRIDVAVAELLRQTGRVWECN